MGRPVYRYLRHSAKGSEWDDHKYIKRVDGTYYYPDNYEGGRHLSDEDTKKLAKETINGNFGNGQKRKDLLGEHYTQVQDKVNEILKSSGSKKVSNVSESAKKKTETAAKKVENKVVRPKVDRSKVFAVYNKKK